MSGRLVTSIVAAALGTLVVACRDARARDATAATQSAAGAVDFSDPAGAPRRVSVQGIALTGIGYDVGSPSAPVVVVDFSDFGCPFCGQFARETFPSLDTAYVRTGKVFFKYVPFVMGMFPNGDQAARAAECAADQGGFWPMYERLYRDQSEWKRATDPRDIFQRYAAANRLNALRFASCYDGQQLRPRTRLADDAAGRLGIRATPTFFIDGHMLEGALPLPQFRQLLDQVVQEAR